MYYLSEHFKIDTELRWNPEGTGGLTETSIVCRTCGSGPEFTEGFFAEEPTRAAIEVKCHAGHVLGVFDSVDDINTVVQAMMQGQKPEIEADKKVALVGESKPYQVPDEGDDPDPSEGN
jgi:hypothetical protein